jgi:hypothetical protein
MHHIEPVTARNEVNALTLHKDGVIAIATLDAIVAGTSNDRVVTVTALDIVVAGAPVDDVVATEAVHHVVSAKQIDSVSDRGASEEVVTACAGDGRSESGATEGEHQRRRHSRDGQNLGFLHDWGLHSSPFVSIRASLDSQHREMR